MVTIRIVTIRNVEGKAYVHTNSTLNYGKIIVSDFLDLDSYGGTFEERQRHGWSQRLVVGRFLSFGDEQLREFC